MSKYQRALNNALQTLVEKAKPISERYERECSGPRNAYTAEKAGKLIDRIDELKRGAAEEIDEAYDSYLKRLEKKALSITGATIDKADMILLESNLYTLNQDEFDLLQDKYEGNRAMERLLAGYAEKKGSEYLKETGRTIDEHGEIRFLSCRFMSDKEKYQLAKEMHDEAHHWAYEGQSAAVSDYVQAMAGDMFRLADRLKE